MDSRSGAPACSRMTWSGSRTGRRQRRNPCERAVVKEKFTKNHVAQMAMVRAVLGAEQFARLDLRQLCPGRSRLPGATPTATARPRTGQPFSSSARPFRLRLRDPWLRGIATDSGMCAGDDCVEPSGSAPMASAQRQPQSPVFGIVRRSRSWRRRSSRRPRTIQSAQSCWPRCLVGDGHSETSVEATGSSALTQSDELRQIDAVTSNMPVTPDGGHGTVGDLPKIISVAGRIRCCNTVLRPTPLVGDWEPPTAAPIGHADHEADGRR